MRHSLANDQSFLFNLHAFHFLETDAFLGEGKPSPRPPPKSASRRNEPHPHYSAVERGFGKTYTLPYKVFYETLIML